MLAAIWTVQRKSQAPAHHPLKGISVDRLKVPNQKMLNKLRRFRPFTEAEVNKLIAELQKDWRRSKQCLHKIIIPDQKSGCRQDGRKEKSIGQSLATCSIRNGSQGIKHQENCH
jgi:hypothetical protein